MRILQRFGPGLAVSALTVVLSTPGLAAADEAAGSSDTTYYISLGDSLASGYQPDVDKDTGLAYTDQLYAQLKQRDPGLKHIRLGCTGETTESLLKGGKCDYPHAKSQLDAALRAMAQHHGKVAYVTLSVGANDIQACVSPAGTLDGACLNTAGQTMGTNLAQITGALRKAGTKNTQFAGSTYYNPFLATWLLGDAGQKAAKESAPLIKAGNAGIAQVYDSTGFEVADVAGAFSSDDFGTLVDLPNAGKVPVNVAKICQLTWACTPKKDPHPNADGHKVMAGAFAAVLSKSDAPGPGTSPTPTTSATPATGKGGADTNDPKTNGDLAETGASSSAPVIAGAGLAVVVAGTGAVYFARRRRTAGQS
ncbi:GDSL-type esterase/lipase family protein [Streptomyces coeruleorubidus]|uniref:GDSL-type esterase/lipase family protein n=1 Tax=Streptomyces coeruleorubidus TaxID=116188 RepID=UPI0036FABD30